MSNVLQVVRVDSRAHLPEKADNDPFNAGYDLRAFLDEPITLKVGQRKVIDTGVKMAIPFGFYGRVAPRSGNSVKLGLDVMAGVIDASFRGPIGVVLINLGQEDVEIVNGMKVAQIIITPYISPTIKEVDMLPSSIRGENGWGSTGQ